MASHHFWSQCQSKLRLRTEKEYQEKKESQIFHILDIKFKFKLHWALLRWLHAAEVRANVTYNSNNPRRESAVFFFILLSFSGHAIVVEIAHTGGWMCQCQCQHGKIRWEKTQLRLCVCWCVASCHSHWYTKSSIGYSKHGSAQFLFILCN